jgi:hypothetical protein
VEEAIKMENKEKPIDELKARLIKELEDEIEEERKHVEEISEILKYAIMSNLKVELVVSNPPVDILSRAVVSPCEIKDGYLLTKTDRGTKIKIELSRIKKATLVGEWGI